MSRVFRVRETEALTRQLQRLAHAIWHLSRFILAMKGFHDRHSAGME